MPISTKNAKYTKRSIFCLLVFTLYSYLCKVFTTKIVIFQRFFWKKSCKLPVDLLYWAALYSKSITVKVSNKAVKVGKLSKINKRKVTPIRERRVSILKRGQITNCDSVQFHFGSFAWSSKAIDTRCGDRWQIATSVQDP